MAYGDILVDSDGTPLTGAGGGLITSDAIAPSAVHIFVISGFLEPSGYASWNIFTDPWPGIANTAWLDLQDKITYADDLLGPVSPRPTFRLEHQIYTGGGNPYQIYNRFRTGRLTFSLPAGVRGNLTRMQLRILASMTRNGSRYDDDGDILEARFTLSEAGDAFASLSDLQAAAGDVVATFEEINDAPHDNAQGAIEFRIDLPVDGINEYESDTFYLWIGMPWSDALTWHYPLSTYETILAELKVAGMKLGLSTTEP